MVVASIGALHAGRWREKQSTSTYARHTGNNLLPEGRGLVLNIKITKTHGVKAKIFVESFHKVSCWIQNTFVSD